MATNKSHIVVVLDRSGSMSSIKDDMQGGLNQFIEDQQKVKGECKLTLAQFDTEYEIVADAINIKDAKKFVLEPRGSTALLDALGKTVTTVRGQIASLAKKDQPKKVVVCVITDGEENASSEWKHGDVMDIIKKCETDGWEFAYLGANQDAIQVGATIGVRGASSMSYAPSAAGVSSTYTSLSANVASFRGGNSKTVEFTEDQRKEAAKK